jgi:arabinogalactan endo-1,4-beta-galactosidase
VGGIAQLRLSQGLSQANTFPRWVVRPRICLCVTLLTFCCAWACQAQQNPGGKSSQYAIGADLSFLPQVEEHGPVFKEDGVTKAALEIFREHSYN